MAEAPYLVALALIEQEGRRALPLAGRSLTAEAAAAEQPVEVAHALALELLLRVWQIREAEHHCEWHHVHTDPRS